MHKTINEVLAHLKKILLPRCYNNQDAAQAESWWLLEQVTKKTQTELIEDDTLTLTHQQWNTLNDWATQRVKKNKPLQYIIGTVPFINLEIIVESPILIPRPETEEWVAWLIKKLESVKNERLQILDIGAGSGCIALALASAFPYATVIGVDKHIAAVELCKKNKEHNKIANAEFLQSDLYQELWQHKQSFDLIVSNPPYISYNEYTKLSKEVTEWEDKNALVASDDGFEIHEKILDGAQQYLTPESVLQPLGLPQLVLECGKGQDKHLEKLFLQANFKQVQIYKDLEKVPRWLTGIL